MDEAAAARDVTLHDILAGQVKIPVAVLTGFLGSGKTTLLNALLRGPASAETAVLVNEFGEVGIDNLLVEETVENVVLLPSGCLCCAVRGDLVEALRGLFADLVNGKVPFFRRVVIETTGLAEPAPIVHTLLTDPALRDRYRLTGVTTVVDALHGAEQFHRHRESIEQVLLADRLVLTKLDLSQPAEKPALVEYLRRLNPGAPVLAAGAVLESPASFLSAICTPPDDVASLSSWLGLTRAAPAHDHHHDHGHRAHEGIESFALEASAPIDWGSFTAWLQDILAEHGPKILRMKGILDVVGEDEPIVVNGVQHVFYPAIRLAGGGKLSGRSALVFITRGLSRGEVERGFLSLLPAPP